MEKKVTNTTKEQLQEDIIILFSTICNMYSGMAWKSRKNRESDKEPLSRGAFIAGIYTPLGQATMNLEEKYWDIFKVSELENSPEYDDYSNKEVILRLQSLGNSVNEIHQKERQKVRK